MGEPLLLVQGLSCRYPGSPRRLFQGLSFSMERGEALLVLGPSGCGKSTLALCLKGLIPESVPAELEGCIAIDGRPAIEQGLSPHIGLVFQDPEAQAIMPRLDEEVAFGLENLRVDPAAMPARIEAALAMTSLAGLARRRVDTLSRGQKQRLALASILAMEPSLLILDEPTANLDPKGCHELFTILGSLKRRGTTILLIEHRVDESLELVDRVMVLDRDGKLLRLDAPARVFGADSGALEPSGIWLPTACRLTGQLRRQGVLLADNPLLFKEAGEVFSRLLARAPRGTAGPPRKVERNGIEEAIGARGLRFTYLGGQPVLRGLSLSVGRGELLALVGANGSGKSTLARILCGLLRPDGGEVFLQDRSTRKMRSRDYMRYIGYVFQNPEHQFVTERVIDELAYSLLRHYATPEAQSRLEQLLKDFDLVGCEQSNPFALSQGQKRRLSVATMVALGQPVLILDEPTFGQDQAGAAGTMDMIVGLHRSGKTVLLITHDMQLVLRYASTVAVMGEGVILFQGLPEQLFQQEHLMEQAGLIPPFEVRLGKRLGDPSLFIQNNWTERFRSAQGL